MKQSFPLLRYAFLMAMCFVFALSARANDGTLLYTLEAENFDTTSFAGVRNVESRWSSNGMYVENISPSQFLQFNNIVVPTEGTYKLRVYYYNRDRAGRNISAWTNQQVRGTIHAPDTTEQWNGGPKVNVTRIINGTDTTYNRDTIWGTQGSKYADILIYCRAGANKLKVGGTPGSTLASGYCPNLDKLELYTTTETIAKPANVPNSWNWDYTREAIITSDKEYPNLRYLTDNKDETVFEINPNGTANITFEFDKKMWINGCLFYLGEDAVFNPDHWDVQYSQNGTDWVSSTRTAKDPMGDGKVYMLTTDAVKYVRLSITANQTVRIAEFQLFGYPRIFEKTAEAPNNVQYPDDLTGRNAIDAAIGIFSANDPGLLSYKEVAANAIDGIQNKYTVNGKVMGMQYEFNNETRVSSFLLGVGMSGDKGRNPKNIKFYGASWDMEFVELANITNFVFPHVDYVSMKFNVKTPGDYVYYKIDIENNGSNMTHISEWQLFSDQILVGDETVLKGITETNNLVNAFGRKGEIKIAKSTQAKASYQLVDLTGRVIRQGQLNSDETIPANAGAYVLRVVQGNMVQTVKVLVK